MSHPQYRCCCVTSDYNTNARLLYQATLPQQGLVLVHAVNVPTVTTSQCSGTPSVSLQVGGNFTNSQSLILNAQPSSLLHSQNVVSSNVAASQSNPQSLLLYSQGIASNNMGTPSYTLPHGMLT